MFVANEHNFLKLVIRNKTNLSLLERLPNLELPDWYLVAGCLFQTVWNELSGFPAEHGIQDYDVFYCDCEDLSWEAEDKVIKRCTKVFSDLGVDVQVRNQARVHLWYEHKYGAPCPQMHSSREGIDSFLNQSSCFGIRSHTDRHFDVYAPYGFTDLFNMVIRPTCNRNTPDVYYKKAQRWSQVWPKLKILAWPDVSPVTIKV